MSKIKIVIASILKPVDDPRSYKRFGLSLAKTNKYEINIIGNTSKINPEHPAIKFHVLQNTFGLSLARLLNRWRVLKKIILLKPQILILTTHEILLSTTVLKFFFRYKLIYDIQENYLRNFWFQDNYFWFFKYPYGLLVRMKEIICSPFIDGSILAEEGYSNEFKFHIKKPHLILQNKAALSHVEPIQKRGWNQLIFTGNLSENSGVLKAIELVEKLREIETGLCLKIIGHCPDVKFREKLNVYCSKKKFINLVSQENPIHHSEIIESICQSGCAIVSYKLNPSNINCIPTKVFECIFLGVPFISDECAAWTKLGEKIGLAIPINFDDFSTSSIINSIKNHSQTPRNIKNEAFGWSQEEPKLLKFVNTIN